MADKEPTYANLLSGFSLYLYGFQDRANDISRRQDVVAANPRGIPTAPFVDKVEDYVTSRTEVEATLKKFQEMIQYVA
jgi:hypothetical protein